MKSMRLQREIETYALIFDKGDEVIRLLTAFAGLLLGNKFFPGVGDRYLAETGYSGQQYDGPADPDRPNNLWEPVAGDHGAHGEFDARASDWSAKLWLMRHRTWVGVAAAVLSAGLTYLLRESPEPSHGRERAVAHARDGWERPLRLAEAAVAAGERE